MYSLYCDNDDDGSQWSCSDFYASYVQGSSGIIEKECRVVETIWRESSRYRLRPSSLIVSFAILRKELESFNLWDNVGLRRVVLTQAFPLFLLTLGLDANARVLRRMSRPSLGPISSRFNFFDPCLFVCVYLLCIVYKYGIDPANQFCLFSVHEWPGKVNWY
jgi:hypothetical protein